MTRPAILGHYAYGIKPDGFTFHGIGSNDAAACGRCCAIVAADDYVAHMVIDHGAERRDAANFARTPLWADSTPPWNADHVAAWEAARAALRAADAAEVVASLKLAAAADAASAASAALLVALAASDVLYSKLVGEA